MTMRRRRSGFGSASRYRASDALTRAVYGIVLLEELGCGDVVRLRGQRLLEFGNHLLSYRNTGLCGTSSGEQRLKLRETQQNVLTAVLCSSQSCTSRCHEAQHTTDQRACYPRPWISS